MSLILTGIIDYSGQAHCMEHAPTVSSYRSEVYAGDELTCWCGRDLSIENLTPWDAAAEELRAEDVVIVDVPEFTPFCPDVFKGCSHGLAMGDEGAVGCVEWISAQCPEGFRPVFIEGEWSWEPLTPEDVKVRAVIASGAMVKGSIVDVPGVGRGVITDRSMGESLVQFYVTPDGGDWFDTSHGRWIPDSDLSVKGFDRESLVWFIQRLTRAGDTLF